MSRLETYAQESNTTVSHEYVADKALIATNLPGQHYPLDKNLRKVLPNPNQELSLDAVIVDAPVGHESRPALNAVSYTLKPAHQSIAVVNSGLHGAVVRHNSLPQGFHEPSGLFPSRLTVRGNPAKWDEAYTLEGMEAEYNGRL